MKNFLSLFEVSINKRLLMAALVWSAAGICLLTRTTLLLASQTIGVTIGVFCAGVLLGAGKARMALIPMAQKIIRHNQNQQLAFLGKFFSSRNWLLIFCMVMLGRVLLATPLPVWAKALILATVGFGMLLSCLTLWRAWRQSA